MPTPDSPGAADDMDINPLLCAPPARPLAIRVFLSSTFRDLVPERQAVMARCQPHLQQLCRERAARLSFVDLRWGITDREAQENRVTEICLREVQRCAPFFIGIIGNRYGWVPEQIPSQTVDRHPWIHDHPDRSITELEMLQGIWYQLAAASPLPVFPVLIFHKRMGAGSDDPRLDGLLDRLRGHPQCQVLSFADADELTQLFNDQVGAALEAALPIDATATPAAIASIRHWNRALDEDGPLLVPRGLSKQVGAAQRVLITGEQGTGKTRLLAHLLMQRHGRRPTAWCEAGPWYGGGGFGSVELDGDDDQGITFYHFSDTDDEARSPVAMIGRWLGLLGIDPADDAYERRQQWLDACRQVARRRPVRIVIDAADRLSPHPAFRVSDYGVLADEVGIAVWVTSGTATGSWVQAGFTVVSCKPIKPAWHTRLLTDLLYNDQTRSLSRQDHAQLQQSPAITGAADVTFVAHDLARIEKHEDLPLAITRWCQAGSVADMAAGLIDEAADWPHTRQLLDVLACSRTGLTDSEACRLLGEGPDQPLSRYALACALLPIHALVTYRYDRIVYRDQAIGDQHHHHLVETQVADQVHDAILAVVDAGGDRTRLLEERSWHLLNRHRLDELRQWLIDERWLFDLWRHHAPDAIHCCQALADAGPLTGDDCVRAMRSDDDVLVAARLLRQLGRLHDALVLLNTWLDGHIDARTQTIAVAMMAVDLAGTLGHLPDMIAAYDLCQRIIAQSDDAHLATALLFLQGQIAQLKGRGDEAEGLFARALGHWQEQGHTVGVMTCLSARGQLAIDTGDLDSARTFFARQLDLAEDRLDPDHILRATTNRTNVLIIEQRFNEALRSLAQEQAACDQLADVQARHETLAREAVVQMELADFDAALACLDTCLAYYESNHDYRGIASTLLKYASMFGQRLGQQAQGYRYAIEAMQAAEAGGLEQLADTCAQLAVSLEQ